MKRRLALGLGLLLLVLGGGAVARLERPATPARAESTAANPAAGAAFDFARVVVRAQRGVRLEGQVIDEDEQPVSGAIVEASPENLHATTEADGSFVFESLSPGQHELSAIKDELSAASDGVLLSASTEPVVLRMQRGTTVVVHVVDDRGPIAGAKIAYLDVAHSTDVTGTARVSGVASGPSTLEVTADGHAGKGLLLDFGDDPGGVVEQTVTLDHGATVEGTVRGPDGAPVADATVSVGGGEEEARTDAHGGWRVAAVAAGTYEITARSATYGPVAPISIELDGTQARRDVVVHVAVDGTLAGTVATADGRALANADVYAWGDRGWSAELSTTSDTSGRFELHGVRAGPWRVGARAGRLCSPVSAVEVDGARRQDLGLVVVPSNIAGTVVDARGDAVAEARVQVISENSTSETSPKAITDAHGRFDLGGLPPGEYTVLASRAGSQPSFDAKADVRTRAGVTNLAVVLPDLSTITGRVLFEGAPLATFSVRTDAWLDTVTTVHNAEGRFTLRAIEPGRHSIIIVGEHTQRLVIPDVRVDAAKVTDIGEISLARGIRLSGHVRTSTGAPVSGARVGTLRSPSRIPDAVISPLQARMSGEFATVTDASGAYSFDDLAPAQDTFAAWDDTLGRSLEEPVPQADRVVDFELAPTSGIDGTVAASDAQRAFVVHVDGVDPALGAHSVFVEADHTFHLARLRPGDYRVEAPGLPSVVVTVPADHSATVTLHGSR